MTRCTTVLAVVAVLALGATASAQISFVIPLEPSQEVPATASTAYGSAYGWLDASNNLTVHFWHNVTGATAAHIHNAPAGSNGGVVFPFSSGASGTTGTFSLTGLQVADLNNGNYYINVHSSTFPGGEIRGQINPLFQPQVYINEYCNDPNGATGGLDTNCDGVAATGAAQSDDEFVEIINGTCMTVDISGWTLADAVATRHTFATGTMLPPFGCIVVFGGGDVTTFNTTKGCAGVVADTGFIGLNNSGDTITLANSGGITIDTTTYTSGSAGDGDGESVVRCPEQPLQAFGLHTTNSPAALAHSAGLSKDGLCKFPPAILPAPVTATYPGNGSDCAIEVRINGAISNQPSGVHSAIASDIISLRFYSPGGTLTNNTFVAFAQVHTTGSPPAAEPTLGLFFNPFSATTILLNGLSNPAALFNPVLGFSQIQGTLPQSLGGTNMSVLVNLLATDPGINAFNLGLAEAQEVMVQ